MSGIATATAQAVALTKGTKASIADTRKTLPGLRALQKICRHHRRRKNHRFNLSDAAMLKDNHIDAGGGITSAISKLREKVGHMTKIEVETRSLDELREALGGWSGYHHAGQYDDRANGGGGQNHRRQSLLEASGNITADTIQAVAATGVDIISIRALTHSVKAFDISMKISL